MFVSKGKMSDWKPVTAIPQGSVLGLILFFINDMVNEVKLNILQAICYFQTLWYCGYFNYIKYNSK